MRDRRLEPRAVGATATVVVHALTVYALLHVTSVALAPAPHPPLRPVVAERLHGAHRHVVSVDLIRPDTITSSRACEGSSYVGIGVTADPRTERIILVGDDTPASRAGLKRDDIVLNPDVWRGVHREGALLELFILRDSVKMAVLVRVGTICIG